MPSSTNHPENDRSPASRGRLMLTKTVRAEFFSDAVSEWWIRRNVAPGKKLRLGHSTVAWYESDVRAWFNGLQDG